MMSIQSLRQTPIRLLFAAMLGLLFTVPAQADSAMELAKDHNADWNRLFNAEKAGELSQLYAEDAVVSPASGKTIKGREAIGELFKGYIDNGLNKHRLTIVEAGGSGQWFYEIAEWRVSGAPQNAVIPLYKGIATIIFKRHDNGKWLIHSHTWNQEK